MAATVIASRHRLSLFLLPAAGPALDVARLREVLARHGLALLDRADLPQAQEFIAGEDLGPAEAAALAEDLRGIGLHARVVNRSGLTTSERVSNALFMQLMIGVPAPALLLMGAGTLLGAGESSVFALVPGVLALVSMVFAACNALALGRAGGAGLQVTGAREAPRARLSAQLESVWAAMLDHLVAPLRERVRALEAYAVREPDGTAAAELQGLLDDLRGQADAQATTEARQLREQIALARKAVREAQGS